VRFSSKILGALAATPVAGFAAYEKAQSGFKPNPPVPRFDEVIVSILSGTDLVASGSAALAALTAGNAIYEIFKPDPATKQDVKDDGRKTREGIEHLSRQGVAETNALIAKIDALEQKLLAQNPSQAQQIESFATTATDLAGSDNAEDRSIAREAVEGDPLAASDRLMAEVEVGVAEQAERARQAARIAAPFSVAKAITAYARAVELDPSDFCTWIELSRLHRAAGSLPQARRTAEAALQHVGGDWDRMVAENTLGDTAADEGQLATAALHYQAGLIAAQAVLTAAPDDTARQREVSISHERLGDVAREEGDLTSARKGYAASLAIRERLAAADPGNAEWQRDLFISHAKFAQFNEASGDVAGAIHEFEAGEAILVALIARVGDHPGYARDLADVREEIARLRGK
jgi:tetratricopeptide (TPR) repeat protein